MTAEPKTKQPDQNGRTSPPTPSPPTPKPPIYKRQWFRRALYVLGGLGLIGAGVTIFRPAPVAVDWVTLERGSLEVAVTEEGKTRVRDRFVIYAPVSGRLQRITLDEGDRVEASQVVARIDPLPLDADVEALQAQIREMQAELRGVDTLRPKPEALAEAEARIRAAIAAEREAIARVDEAEAALNQAQRDRQRAAMLYQEGAIPEQSLEEAQLDETTRTRTLEAAQRSADRAHADVTEAREALQRLQAEQQDPDYLLDVYNARIRSLEAELTTQVDEARRTDITAPQAGRVLRVEQESNRFVEAGMPLLELGNAQQLELVVDVLSRDAVRIQPGDPVRIEQWGGEAPLMGTVRTVEPSAFTDISALGVEEQRVNIIVDFNEMPSDLGDGYRTEAQIIVWQDSDILTVPIGALFRCEPDWCVFAVEGNRADRRSVKIGHRNQTAAEVVEGLSEADVVILHPSETIQDGTRVESRE
ncbi:MAG: efflux RND transporter periplasmic adaptor subunit [Elainellaceae cyanobacterium]